MTIDTLEDGLAKHKERKQIIRLFTLLSILDEKGGIAISHNLLFTEDLAWLSGIRTYPHLNGNFTHRDIQVVGFFDPEISSEAVADYYNGELRRTVALPALQTYFLAAKNKTHFMK
jgi:hypothetical protein